MIRLIAKSKNGPVDTTRIHELTSWPRLDGDLEPFFVMLAKREEPAVRRSTPRSGPLLARS